MWGFNCYSLIKNECHGGCQGCGCCPSCYNFHNETHVNQNRWGFFWYWFVNIFLPVVNPYAYYKDYRVKKALDEYFESPEGKEFIEKFKNRNKHD